MSSKNRVKSLKGRTKKFGGLRVAHPCSRKSSVNPLNAEQRCISYTRETTNIMVYLSFEIVFECNSQLSFKTKFSSHYVSSSQGSLNLWNFEPPFFALKYSIPPLSEYSSKLVVLIPRNTRKTVKTVQFIISIID